MSSLESVVSPQDSVVTSQDSVVTPQNSVVSNQDSIVSPIYMLLKTSAPGKVILHGEHSVVYGKLAVAASLGLRTHVELLTSEPIMDVERFDVCLCDLSYNGSFELGHIKKFLETPTPTLPSSGHLSLSNPECLDHDALVKLVKFFLVGATATAANDKFATLTEQQQTALLVLFYLFKAILSASRARVELRQMLVKVRSELHLGCGMGSSASYAVALAATFVRFVDVGYRYAAFDDESQLANVISKWAFQAERIAHGTPSGIDNTICAHGYWVQFARGGSVELLKLANSKFKVILINTLVPRNTRDLVEKVVVLRQKHPRVIDGVFDVMDTITKEAVQNLKDINGGSGDVLTYYEKLQDLSELNQKMLRVLDVSHPIIEMALKILASNGLKGKLTGAGGGGCVICMVPPDVTEDTVKSTLKRLQAENYRAEFTDLAGEGVRFD